MSDNSFTDPKIFRPEAIDPETDAFNRKLEEELAEIPPLYTIAPPVIRAARAAGQSVFGPIKRLDEAQDRTIPGPAGDIPLRIFVPEKVSGVYLHIHGGGFMLGTVDQHDEMLVGMGKACNVAVVSVGYRLAPENPYPAGPDDCEAAAVWLAENAKFEFGSNRLFIGGESAGANLSATTLLRMRDRHNFTGFCGAVLPYGVFDIGMTPSVRRWGERNLILTTKIIDWFNTSYIQDEDPSSADISPLYADLNNMPPALFSVGTLDPLLDDSLFMHARWAAAGNRAELDIYPGGVHAFNVFPIKIAQQANARIVDFIKGILM